MILETPEQTVTRLEEKKKKIEDHIFMKTKEIEDIDKKINILIEKARLLTK